MSHTENSARALVAYLQDLQRAGLEILPRFRNVEGDLRPAEARTEPSGSPTLAEAKPIAQSVRPEQRPSESTSPTGELFEMAERNTAIPQVQEGKSTAPTLEILAEEVAACTQCAELASTRTQTVFADGNPRARLVFLGEAPGADEDAQGTPFVGRAGKLLTDIIEQGMKLRRKDDVYIMNVLKCRPPGNRNPLPHEAHSCRRFLLRQLELVDPEFICCLGAVAAQNLLETTQPIGKLRGRFHDWHGIQVVCTYHPAYLLRNPAAKRQTWQDIQMLMEAMEVGE